MLTLNRPVVASALAVVILVAVIGVVDHFAVTQIPPPRQYAPLSYPLTESELRVKAVDACLGRGGVPTFAAELGCVFQPAPSITYYPYMPQGGVGMNSGLVWMGTAYTGEGR